MSCLVRLSNIYYNLHYILLILGICFFQSTSKVPYIKTLNKQSSCTKFRGQNGQQQVRPLRSASLQTQSSKTNDIALASFDLRWTSRIAKKNRLLPAPSSRGAKWFRYRVSIHHPLGFNWHPLEDHPMTEVVNNDGDRFRPLSRDIPVPNGLNGL